MTPWNWQLPNWPKFHYDPSQIIQEDKQFLLKQGSSMAFLKSLEHQHYHQFIVEILSYEVAESSRIEGEMLDRESLQSSIKRHFGLTTPFKKESDKESRMAKLLLDVYETFDLPLTHEMLYTWHAILFDGHSHIENCGKYRSHEEPMQIVSNRYGSTSLFFEAPPSAHIPNEMTKFIKWFNSPKEETSLLGKAAIAHLYFESIHPFEDGNGRIGRVLVEKILSRSTGRPLLIAVSKVLEKRKKEYYAELEKCNKTLDAQYFVEFFINIILQAQQESTNLLSFLTKKTKILTSLSGKINERQEKVLVRMFEEGPEGFRGGLSAKNYITITKTSHATATRDLNDLVEQGALTKTGELRHTRYWLPL